LPSVVNAIVEVPQGRRTKFELDKSTGLMKLDGGWQGGGVRGPVRAPSSDKLLPAQNDCIRLRHHSTQGR